MINGGTLWQRLFPSVTVIFLIGSTVPPMSLL
jgi:hypothetical protein